MMDYEATVFDRCLTKVFDSGVEGSGMDSISNNPQVRGIESVAEYVADYTLAAVMKGLGLEPGSPEYKKTLAAYVNGKQAVDPAAFSSPLNRGKIRSI